MENLFIKLCPFSPDYSGASSVLYDYHTVSVLHDASGCTGNYCGYDEPRWQKEQRGIFSSSLKEIDAVMGDDEKLVRKMLEAIEDIKPELAAILGTPVPMVIGTDVIGVAKEVETLSGVPTIGVDSTGTRYYDYGVYQAVIELIKKFADKSLPKSSHGVNILGVNAIDFANEGSVVSMVDAIEDAGMEVITCAMVRKELDQIKKMLTAKVNLAVNRSGYFIAKYMEKHYGMPYVCFAPYGASSMETLLGALKEAMKAEENAVIQAPQNKKGNVLIIGEQVMSNAIRYTLDQDYGIQDAVVGCLFDMDHGLNQPYDLDLRSERQIKEAVNSYDVIIGDPDFKMFLKDTDTKFIEIPHYGVSSKTTHSKHRNLIGEKLNAYLKQYIQE